MLLAYTIVGIHFLAAHIQSVYVVQAITEQVYI